MYIAIAFWTKDVVTIPEALITLAFFVILCVMAFTADKISANQLKRQQIANGDGDGRRPNEIGRLFNLEDFYHILKMAKKKNNVKTMKPNGQDLEEAKEEQFNKSLEEGDNEPAERSQKENKKELEKYLREIFKVDDITKIKPEEVRKAIEPKAKTDKMKYKRVIGKAVSGRKPFVVIKGMKKHLGSDNVKELKKPDLNLKIGFKCSHYSVSEGAGFLEATIYLKNKRIHDSFKIGVRTLDDTACAPDDYQSIDEILVFQKDEIQKTIKVKIIEDNEWEPNEDFLIELYDVNTSKKLKGRDTQTRVSIIKDNGPGKLGFKCSKMNCQSKNKTLSVKVARKHGSEGILQVKYRVEEAEGEFRNKAEPYKHFLPKTGTLIFGN